MKPSFVTVTCFDPQPREWFTTVNTIGFDRDKHPEEITYTSNPPGPLYTIVPPYGGRYAVELKQHPRKPKKK